MAQLILEMDADGGEVAHFNPFGAGDTFAVLRYLNFDQLRSIVFFLNGIQASNRGDFGIRWLNPIGIQNYGHILAIPIKNPSNSQ